MADCFAFLTQGEGLALVQLEAAACGLPLVLTEGHCPPGLVENGENEFMVPPDEREVAPKLDLLASDPDFRERAGEASRQRALRFTWDEQARKIEEFFGEHLEETRG
jgi:glycosyltransferase involved in cell wall biosynthesis